MSKYTTEVRFICESLAGKRESVGELSVDDMIGKSMGSIFSFSFPIFDEKYREVLERKIIKHFYTREIGYETYGLWKLKLDTKMNEIMPYYNKMYMSELLDFNPMYTTDLETNHSGKGNINDNTKSNSSGNVESKNNGNVKTDASGNSTANSKDLYSDTPQGWVGNLEAQTYLTNARIINDGGNSSTTSSEINSSNGNVSSSDKSESDFTRMSTDDYLDTVKGYSGINPSKLLQDYRDTFLNIDMMIINDLEDLFIQLW